MRREVLTVNTVAVMLDPQVNVELEEIPHEPFEDFRVKPEPDREH